MSLSNNDIDKIFQKAANKAPAPVYSDTYWDEMEAMLATESPKRKKGFFWIFSGTIACVALIVFGLNYNSTIDRNIAQANSNDIIDINKSNSQNIENSTVVEKETPVRRIKNPLEPQVFDESMIASDNENSPTQLETSVDETDNDVEYRSVKEKKGVAKKKVEGSRIKPNTMTLADDDRRRTNVTPTKVQVEKKKLAEINASKDKENSDNKLFNLELEPLPLQSIPNQAQSSDIYKRSASISNKNTFYGIIGVGTSQKLTESQSGIPLTTNIGLGYQINHQSLFARIGLEANATFVPGIEISQRSLVYNFGVNEYSNEYRYTKLLDIDLPLEIGYRTKDFNIGLGTKFSYLVASEIQLTQRVNENIVEEGNYYGQAVGLKKFNLSNYVVAETALNNRFSVGGRAGVNWNTRLNSEITVDEPRTNAIFGNVFLKINF